MDGEIFTAPTEFDKIMEWRCCYKYIAPLELKRGCRVEQHRTAASTLWRAFEPNIHAAAAVSLEVQCHMRIADLFQGFRHATKKSFAK